MEQLFAGGDVYKRQMDGSVARAFAYVVVGGLAALVVTFGPAVRGNWPEASFISGAVRKVARKLKR